MYRHLLVPVDGSDSSVEGVGNAVALAHRLSARISFLDLGQQAERSTSRERLAKAEAAARAFGVPCESAADGHGDLVAQALARACDLVLVTSEHDERLGPQARAALAAAGIALLVSAVPQGTRRSRAIGIIRDDHRSLAAVLHLWMKALAAADTGSRAADPRLMRAIVDYVRGFSSERHHPREESQIFTRLRQRSEDAGAEIDELERQHAREHRMVGELERLTARMATASAGEVAEATHQLAAAVEAYTLFAWEHMGREEGVLLPAAHRHLDAADWSAIDAAFASDGARDAPFRELFSRIVAFDSVVESATPSDEKGPG